MVAMTSFHTEKELPPGECTNCRGSCDVTGSDNSVLLEYHGIYLSETRPLIGTRYLLEVLLYVNVIIIINQSTKPIKNRLDREDRIKTWTKLEKSSSKLVGRQLGRHLAASQTISSQPLMLHPVIFVYDQPTGTVSLYLAVDSARMAVGRLTTPARQSGTRYQMNLEILTVLITLNGS